MTLEHHRDLAHEFPKLKQRIHDLKLESVEFRRLYEEYEALDNAVHRIEQGIETPSDAYTETLKHRRAQLKDRLYGLLCGRLHLAADVEEYVLRAKFRVPVDRDEVARAWSEQGFSCELVSAVSHQHELEVSRGKNAMLAVIDGELAIELHGAHYALAPGDVMFLPREMPYRIRGRSAQEARWLYGHD